jgi:hypothetical protein
MRNTVLSWRKKEPAGRQRYVMRLSRFSSFDFLIAHKMLP